MGGGVLMWHFYYHLVAIMHCSAMALSLWLKPSAKKITNFLIEVNLIKSSWQLIGLL